MKGLFKGICGVLLVFVVCLSLVGCVTLNTKIKVQDQSGNSITLSDEGVEVDIKEIPCFDSFTCSTDPKGD